MANLLATCATKLTVNGTTTAPESMMVCGNARFVSSSTNNIYMGTSHGSVDIDFNRAASQDLKIRTYSGGWNTALRILGTGVFACSYLQSPTLCATTCIKAHSLRATTGQNYVCLYSGCSNSQPGGIYFRSCGGTSRGYVYFDGTSNFGLLNCSGQWALRIVGNHSSGNMYTCHPLEAATSFKTPILCATSCTNYGACATSKLTSDGDNMRHTTQHGYMQFGPGNASYAHFNTDRPQFYFNKKLVVNAGQVESYDEDLVLQRTSSGTNRIKITTDTTHICQYTNIAGKLAVNAAGCTCCCALNCGKADFEVITGGTATAAWTGGRFRVGADDVNWSTRITQSGYFQTYSSNLHVAVATNNKCVILCPHGTGFTKACGTLCVTGPTNLGDLLTVNTICATSGMSRSFPTWSTVGTRYLPQVNASANLPVGWYTIFVNTGNRAGGRFILRDTTGSRHQYVVFYASHSYGQGNSINVLQYSRYSGQPIQCIRVKDFSTYDGAALQVYVCDACNNLVAYEAGDNVHSSGWYFLNSWCCDACVPYSTSCFNACWPAGCYCDGASVNLHCIQDGGQILTGKLYAPVMRPTTCIQVGNAGTAKILLNASYNTLELCGHGSEMMIGAGSTGININYRCAGSGASTTPANWYWRCGTSTSFSNHYFALVCSCSLIKGNILCGATCVYSNCLYVNNAQADVCVKSPTLCATSKFQGSCLHIDAGNLNSGNDAAVYVTATNNNDWGIVVNKNNGSATDYAFDARMGASAGYAYYARFNNTVKFTVRHDCLCHASLIKSPILCAPTCVSAAVVCSTGIVRATAGCFVSSADSCFSGMIKTCCNLVVGAGGANRTLSVRHIDGKCHTADTSDTLYLQYSTGKNVIVGSGSSTSHLYTYGNIYGCGSCISTATVCATTCVQTAKVMANEHFSTSMLWSSTDMKNQNFWVCTGDDSFSMGQGGTLFDLWVSDSSISHQPRSILRAYNQGNCIVLGQGCNANTNATIPVYACSCLQSPMLCATSCVKLDGGLKFTQNTPYICTGGAYLIVPSGIYVSGGTLYAENSIMARNGICDDTAAALDIWGGNDSTKTTRLRGKTFVCNCLYVHCNICLAPDTSGDMQNGISLGKANGLPQAAWGETGCKTGRIEIGLPTRDGEGGSSHHGMVHVAVDVYEYNSNDVMTFIVGGHNWNCRWYHCGAHITGGCTGKTIKLAYHSCGGTNNGRYVILLGESNSNWCYGSVHVRSITNGLYYCDNMNLGTPWYVKRVTCADSYYYCTTADLRCGSQSMAAYQCAMVCLHTPRVCATTCLKSANVCATTMMCSAGCILTPTCVHGGSVIATTVASIHTGGASCCGLAVGQTFSNEGGWHNQLNTYGSQHNIIRIKKASGDTADNAQCFSFHVHNSHPATIRSTGNIRICAAGGMAQCLKSGLTCTPVLCAPTCVVSSMVFPTGCLQFDQQGTRSWKVCASSGNLNFHSGDGSGSFYFHSQVTSNVFCGTSSIQSHSFRSGANNMCLCPSGCGYGIFFGPSDIGEKQHWTTSAFTASGTQARRAKLLEFSYNTHHWDSGGPIFIDIYHNYFGKGSHQRWQVVQTGLDGTGSQNCSAGADLPAGARDVRLMLLESNGDDTLYYKLHLDMHAAGYKISDYDIGIAEVYLDVDYYAQVYAKVTLHGTWNNINTGASFTSNNSSQYKFYNSPSYTNISAFHNSPPTVPSVAGRSLYAERIYGHSSWQACCQNCYTNVCSRYLCLRGTSCMAELKTSGLICGSGLICANSCLYSPVMCFSSCLYASGGCIKVPIIEGRYSNSNTNYRGGLCWNAMQLGNNGQNRIIAGATATGGYLDIFTNNTADHLGGTNTNGCHTVRFCTNGYTAFYDWIQLANSKGIFTATNNGHFRGNTTSDYGTWDILGHKGGWGGIYICGMTVMACCNCGAGGLFNDIDNEWLFYAERNGSSYMYHNGSIKLKTLSGGACACGCLTSAVVCGTSHMNSGKFCSGSTYLCNGCAHVSGKICSTTGFYGDGSNLTGISGGEANVCATCKSVTIGPNTYSSGNLNCCNIWIGCDAGSGGRANQHIGASAGQNSTGSFNTSIGNAAHPSLSSGSYNIAIGSLAGQSITSTKNHSISIGSNGCSGGCCVVIGNGWAGMFKFGGQNDTCGQGCFCIDCFNFSGAVSKSSGTFKIMHPNPEKHCTKDLNHSFVESPNEGDNIYRWQVETTNCSNVITLPNYYRFLNKNDVAWVAPHKHFGSAYGEVTADQCCLVICSNVDGCYNVLLIGTRKDPAAERGWNGVETDADEHSPNMIECKTFGDWTQQQLDFANSNDIAVDQMEAYGLVRPVISSVWERNVDKANCRIFTPDNLEG